MSDIETSDQGPVDHPKSAPDDRAENGPLDEAEANPVRPYVDLGGVKILPREGLHLRLEIEEESKRVVDAIEAVPTDGRDKPLEDVVITGVDVETL